MKSSHLLERNKNLKFYFLGQEWAVFKLGFPGKINQICVDTAHFKGNFPDSAKVDGTNLGSGEWTQETSDVYWQNILGPSKVKQFL